MKHFLLLLAKTAAFAWALVPFQLRRGIYKVLLLLESRVGSPQIALSHLFLVHDDLELFINERATAFGAGTHPKHRLTGYHDFFVQRIPNGARVLDVGCGIGAVAHSIARNVPGVSVTGIDVDPAFLGRAQLRVLPNLEYRLADAWHFDSEGPWNVIVISNMLEHIGPRVELLKTLVGRCRPDMLLVRVPLFERHWHLPLRRELGISYFSDPTHHIEHNLNEFQSEMQQADLKIVEIECRWGEIWSKLVPCRTAL